MRSGSASLRHLSRERERAGASPRAHARGADGTDGQNIVAEKVQFRSGPYMLEGELAYANPPFLSPANGSEEGGVRGGVVLAGSHPLLGGNMHNNVVRGLGDGLAEYGWVTLRLNYRGVGRSEGPRVDVAAHMAEFWKTSHVEGEMDLWQDVQSAAAYLRPIIGQDRPLVLIGYSFGCALLPPLCRTEAPAAVVLIAPPLGKHDYTDFATVKSPLLAVVSTDDFTLEPARLRAWFDGLPDPKRLVQAAADNHFFRGHESWLVETVSAYLSEQVQ
jgi:alpha/beta superfamily hydrolase